MCNLPSLCEHGPAQTHLLDKRPAGQRYRVHRLAGRATDTIRAGRIVLQSSVPIAGLTPARSGPGGTAMQITRRNFLATGAGAITATAAAPAFAAWEEST